MEQARRDVRQAHGDAVTALLPHALPISNETVVFFSDDEAVLFADEGDRDGAIGVGAD